MNFQFLIKFEFFFKLKFFDQSVLKIHEYSMQAFSKNVQYDWRTTMRNSYYVS